MFEPPPSLHVPLSQLVQKEERAKTTYTNYRGTRQTRFNRTQIAITAEQLGKAHHSLGIRAYSHRSRRHKIHSLPSDEYSIFGCAERNSQLDLRVSEPALLFDYPWHYRNRNRRAYRLPVHFSRGFCSWEHSCNGGIRNDPHRMVDPKDGILTLASRLCRQCTANSC